MAMSTNIELEPQFLGFCIGVPGQPCGKRIDDSDVMAVVVPRLGVIGDCCQPKLLTGTSWGAQLDVALGAPKQEGSYRDPRRSDAFVGAGKKHKPDSGGFRLPGSPYFDDKKKPGQHWRNYSK